MEKQKKSKSEWFFVPHFENNLPHEEEHSKESDFYLFFSFIFEVSTDVPIVKQS